MNMPQAAASLAALTILAGAPALARAAVTNDPIVVSNALVEPGGVSRDQGPASLSVAIKNTGDVAATDIVFELDVDGAYARHINDVGSFQPGATVKHTYRVSSDESNQQLKVVGVKFANGDVWAGDPTAAAILTPGN
jgi:hypothetical protein